MAKITLAFGALLFLLGVACFMGTSRTQATLFPAYFGVALAICGWLANSPDNKRRMIVMHIAVTVGLLGLIASAVMAGMDWNHTQSDPAARFLAFELLMAAVVFCIYVGLCVRSFIAARRERNTGPPGTAA